MCRRIHFVYSLIINSYCTTTKHVWEWFNQPFWDHVLWRDRYFTPHNSFSHHYHHLRILPIRSYQFTSMLMIFTCCDLDRSRSLHRLDCMISDGDKKCRCCVVEIGHAAGIIVILVMIPFSQLLFKNMVFDHKA